MPTTPASSTRYASFADIDGFPSPFSGDLFGFDPMSHHHLLLQPSQLPTPVHGGSILLTPHHVLPSTSSSSSVTVTDGHSSDVVNLATNVGGSSSRVVSMSATSAAGELHGGPASDVDSGSLVGQATEDEVSSSCLGVVATSHRPLMDVDERQHRGTGAVLSREQLVQRGSDVEEDMKILW